jgi:hypothetical protein
MSMHTHDEPYVEDLPELCGCAGGARGAASQDDEGFPRGSLDKDPPPLESIQSALYGAVRFAESFLGAAGVAGVRLSRVVCSPDARHWTLAFGEHFFLVEVLGNGFSVRSHPPASPALAA